MNIIRYQDRIEKDNRITILSLSWRDIKSPTAGGAEVHTHEMLKRMDSNKYRIIHLSALYDGLKNEENIDGVNYIRKGNVFSVILYAWLFYVKNRSCIDYVIDQCNTHRFFTPLWVKNEKRIFYIHQLTREIWDINLKFPFNIIGKRTENFLLRLNNKDYAIIVSESTKNDLVDVGFNINKLFIVPNGISFEPWTENEFLEKEKNPTFIYAGRYAKYKGIDVAIEAFGKFKNHYPNTKLWILGKRNEEYIEKNLMPICQKYGLTWGTEEDDSDIISWGFVSEEKKLELLSRSKALLFPSIREGWGIPITEAANVGTPSIVFDSPGIRDAVNFGQAGYLCKANTSEGLYEQLVACVQEEEQYTLKRKQAYEFSKTFVWENTGKKADEFIDSIEGRKQKN